LISFKSTKTKLQTSKCSTSSVSADHKVATRTNGGDSAKDVLHVDHKVATRMNGGDSAKDVLHVDHKDVKIMIKDVH
jgi:hypothetical protein